VRIVRDYGMNDRREPPQCYYGKPTRVDGYGSITVMT
jgi:hypothetical protein